MGVRCVLGLPLAGVSAKMTHALVCTPSNNGGDYGVFIDGIINGFLFSGAYSTGLTSFLLLKRPARVLFTCVRRWRLK